MKRTLIAIAAIAVALSGPAAIAEESDITVYEDGSWRAEDGTTGCYEGALCDMPATPEEGLPEEGTPITSIAVPATPAKAEPTFTG